MKIYTLIGTMKVDEGTGTLENGRMMYVPTVTTSEKEMRELTDWYDYTCTKWSEITISEEAKETVKTRVIYTWRDEEGNPRIFGFCGLLHHDKFVQDFRLLVG
jgi:hypothetical protein